MPAKRPPDHLILENRRKEDKLREAQRLYVTNEFNDLKNEWERWTDKKIMLNNVKQEVSNRMKVFDRDIEERRYR